MAILGKTSITELDLITPLSVDNIATGTSSTTVARGDHSHGAGKYTDSATTKDGHYTPTTATSLTKNTSGANYYLTGVTLTLDGKGHVTAISGAESYDDDTNTWRPVYNGVDSTDTSSAATANAVKTAYDKAVSAYNLASGKTSNAGTVTSVKVTGGTGLSSGGTVTNTGTIILNHAVAYSGTSLTKSTSGANYYLTGVTLTLDGLGHVTAISGGESYDDNTNTDTKVTSPDNHYAITGTTNATTEGTSTLSWGGTIATGVYVDAKGHVAKVNTAKLPSNPNTDTNYYLTGVTGNGNSTSVTLGVKGYGNVTWNASHSHSEYSGTGHTHSSYANQNAFSNVTVGTTTIAADTTTDTLTLAAGNFMTLTPDATNDKVTFTVNTGTTSTTVARGDHSHSGYATTSSLASYLPLAGGTMTGAITTPANIIMKTNGGGIILDQNSGTTSIMVRPSGTTSGGNSVLKLDGTTLNLGSSNYNTTVKGASITLSANTNVTGSLTVGGNAVLTAYTDTNYYLSGVTGSGNGTVTFKRKGLTTDITWDASHTHSGYASSSHSHAASAITGGTSGYFLKSDANGKGVWSAVTIPTDYAPQSHASTAATYGLGTNGTSGSYGHVRLINGDLSGYTATSAYSNGVAAAAQHTHSQYLTSHQDISGKAPNNHASTTGTYGVATSGSSGNYGHVRLTTGDLNGKTYVDGYAASQSHTHSQYAVTGHSHPEYASTGHTHTNYVTTGGGQTIAGLTTFNKVCISANSATYGTGATLYFGDSESEAFIKNSADTDLTIYAKGTLHISGGTIKINNTTAVLTDSATTKSGHYDPGYTGTSLGTSGKYLTGVTLDGKGHVTGVGTGTPYSLPNASTTQLGGIKVGSFLSASSGVLTVSTGTTSTTIARGDHSHSGYVSSDGVLDAWATSVASGGLGVVVTSGKTNATNSNVDALTNIAYVNTVCGSSYVNTLFALSGSSTARVSYSATTSTNNGFPVIQIGATASSSSTDNDSKVYSTTTTSKYYLLGSTASTSTTGTTVKNTNIYASGSGTSTTLYAPKISATTMTATTAFYQSDERLKDFCGEIDVDFEKLKEIPKKYYTWKSDENKELQIGTSAQKVLEVYPELVGGSEDTNYAVDYARLSIVALKAIDKLHDENQTLRDLVEKMDKRITELEEKLK